MKGTVLDPDHVFEFGAPVSAKRHQNLFSDEVVPRTDNFNPDLVSWLSGAVGLLHDVY